MEKLEVINKKWVRVRLSTGDVDDSWVRRIWRGNGFFSNVCINLVSNHFRAFYGSTLAARKRSKGIWKMPSSR